MYTHVCYFYVFTHVFHMGFTYVNCVILKNTGLTQRKRERVCVCVCERQSFCENCANAQNATLSLQTTQFKVICTRT